VLTDIKEAITRKKKRIIMKRSENFSSDNYHHNSPLFSYKSRGCKHHLFTSSSLSVVGPILRIIFKHSVKFSIIFCLPEHIFSHFFFPTKNSYIMPPIRQLDEAFLTQLLGQDDSAHDSILNRNIDSESLSLVLKKLSSTSNAYQQELFQVVHSNFDEFSAAYNTSQKLHADIFQLVKQATDKEELVTNTQSTVRSTIEAYQDALAASQKNETKMDTLEKLERMLHIIELINQELKASGYLKAVDHILELTRIFDSWTIGDARVMNMIKDRIGHLKQQLILSLQEDLQTAIQYNMGSMRILERFQPPNTTSTTKVHLKDVFQCLDQLGLLAEELMGVQRQIFKHILNRYFNNVQNHLQVDHVNVDHLGSGGVLQVIPSTVSNNEEIQKVDPIQMLQHMDTILAFFFKYIFDNSEDSKMNLLFGNLLLPDLMEKLILKGIAPAIPSSKCNLGDFNIVTQSVSKFEHQIASYGFTTESTTALGSYVENIDKHYAKKRREKILQEGRKVMIRKLYDSEMTQVVEDGYTYHYQITQTPQILSVLITDTLTEAVDLLESHPISASTLVEGIQDLLDMYRAMMPSYHRPQYLSSPANSLVFRNDCLWLAHQIKFNILNKPETRHFNKLTATLKESSDRLTELGKAWHELTMMHRVQMIQNVLDSLDGFTGMAENPRFQQDCDAAISQVIQLVSSFATETRPVVDETIFLDMLGRMVDRLLCRLISDIEELVDIGAEESHVIAVTLNSLAQLVGAFDSPTKDATESDVVELVPSWEKFWLVKDILEMNMKEIMESFRRGDLHMFEKSELIGLLCALFADTELRESNIQEIKTGISSSSAHRQLDRSISVSPQSFNNQPPTHASIIVPTQNAFEYTPDDDMLEEGEAGWGDDDDDLFADESLHLPTATPPNTATTTDTLSTPAPMVSLEPSPSLDLDIDMDEGGGWGDADEDIFDDDVHEDHQEENEEIDNIIDQQEHHQDNIIPDQHQKQENDINMPDQHQNSNIRIPDQQQHSVPETSNQFLNNNENAKIVMTTDEPQQERPPATNLGTSISDSATINTASTNPTTTDIARTSITTNNTQPASKNLSLDLAAIDHEIDQELEEESGEGWGWDDGEDLFKDQEDLR
jgi:hypothetical protein